MRYQTHELKCWPKLFAQTVAGEKDFEYRRNDRNFKVGDTLKLREWDPEEGKYLGGQMHLIIQRIWSSADIPLMKQKYVIMKVKYISHWYVEE